MLTATMPFDDRNIPTFLSCVEKGVYPDPANVSESEYVCLTVYLATYIDYQLPFESPPYLVCCLSASKSSIAVFRLTRTLVPEYEFFSSYYVIKRQQLQ